MVSKMSMLLVAAVFVACADAIPVSNSSTSSTPNLHAPYSLPGTLSANKFDIEIATNAINKVNRNIEYMLMEWQVQVATSSNSTSNVTLPAAFVPPTRNRSAINRNVTVTKRGQTVSVRACNWSDPCTDGPWKHSDMPTTHRDVNGIQPTPVTTSTSDEQTNVPAKVGTSKRDVAFPPWLPPFSIHRSGPRFTTSTKKDAPTVVPGWQFGKWPQQRDLPMKTTMTAPILHGTTPGPKSPVPSPSTGEQSVEAFLSSLGINGVISGTPTRAEERTVTITYPSTSTPSWYGFKWGSGPPIEKRNETTEIRETVLRPEDTIEDIDNGSASTTPHTIVKRDRTSILHTLVDLTLLPKLEQNAQNFTAPHIDEATMEDLKYEIVQLGESITQAGWGVSGNLADSADRVNDYEAEMLNDDMVTVISVAQGAVHIVQRIEEITKIDVSQKMKDEVEKLALAVRDLWAPLNDYAKQVFLNAEVPQNEHLQKVISTARYGSASVTGMLRTIYPDL